MTAMTRDELIAQEFWQGTGLVERFPREIETAVALKLPLTLVKLPLITTEAVHTWLDTRKLRATLPEEPRELMGCLVAYRGFGVAFISGADAPEEQRLTIAHETAHFLKDYLLPRREILAAVGESIAEVLDGHRAASWAERANAVLAHVRIGVHVHLLPRRTAGHLGESHLVAIEDHADALGLELVAPRTAVNRLAQRARAIRQPPSEMLRRLSGHFGLPDYAFTPLISRPARPTPISFLDDIRSNLIPRASSSQK